MMPWWLERKAVAHTPIVDKAESEQMCVCVLPPEGCTTKTPNTPLAWNQEQKYNLFKPPERFTSELCVKKDVGKTMCVYMWHTRLIYHL